MDKNTGQVGVYFFLIIYMKTNSKYILYIDTYSIQYGGGRCQLKYGYRDAEKRKTLNTAWL